MDCPTCGRSIRVPRLDGTIAPLPKPALDLRDAELLSALNQLAMIGKDDPGSDADVPHATPSTGVIARAPAPAPVPVAIEPPLSAERVSAGPAAPRPALRAPAPVRDEPAIGALVETDFPAGRVARREPGGARVRLGVLIAVACIAGVPAFVAGFGIGRATAPVSGAAGAASDESGAGPVAASTGARAGEAVMEPAIVGRVTWETDSGERRPDRGARILVLPRTRAGESAAKLPVEGFRPADEDARRSAARAAIRAAEGELAVADERGEFAIELPRGGEYTIVAISRFQQAGEGGPDADARRTLAEWFQRPEQLFGRLAHTVDVVRYSGERAAIWDHTFQRGR